MGDEKRTVPVKGSRQERLKQALRENLKRRKAQARERRNDEATPANPHEAKLDDSGDSQPRHALPRGGEL